MFIDSYVRHNTIVFFLDLILSFTVRGAVQRPVMVTPLSQLVRDPYVVVTAGAVMVATSTLAVLEPCLPIWLTDNLHLQVPKDLNVWRRGNSTRNKVFTISMSTVICKYK